MVRVTTLLGLLLLCSTLSASEQTQPVVAPANHLSLGSFRWVASQALLEPMEVDGEKWVSVKDPSIVRYRGKWHLFCTVRGVERSHAIIYLTFAKWSQARQATQQVLKCHPGYFCAPQVFYFTPQKRWYMLCQASDESWDPKYGPAFSSTKDITQADSWSGLTPLYENKPANIKRWLDFWVICDDSKAHLFFTSLNGKMWRAETALERFPRGWSRAVVALQADVFEASHTYRLRGQDKYLTLIEAQHGHGWRYYKAYVADRLDGRWVPLASEKDRSFASMLNVEHGSQRWTDVISHGELLRAGYDEKLEADPENLRFLFQGVLNRDRASKNYGQIPWRLGILEPVARRTGGR